MQTGTGSRYLDGVELRLCDGDGVVGLRVPRRARQRRRHHQTKVAHAVTALTLSARARRRWHSLMRAAPLGGIDARRPVLGALAHPPHALHPRANVRIVRVALAAATSVITETTAPSVLGDGTAAERAAYMMPKRELGLRDWPRGLMVTKPNSSGSS